MGPCPSWGCSDQIDTVRQPEEVRAEQCLMAVWDQPGSSAGASLWAENREGKLWQLEENISAVDTQAVLSCCLHPCCRIGGAVSPWESYVYICSTAAEEPAGLCLT